MKRTKCRHGLFLCTVCDKPDEFRKLLDEGVVNDPWHVKERPFERTLGTDELN